MGSYIPLGDFTDDFEPFTALLTVGGEGHIADPHPELARLRRSAPVHALDLHSHFGAPRHVYIGDRPVYTVLGFAEVNETLNNLECYSNKHYESNLGVTFGKTVTAMDAPEHTRYRRLFQAAFTPRMLDSLRARFQAVIDRLMARFVDRGHADLVQEFAFHFPFQFIMDLMSMPEEQRPLFHKLAIAQMVVSFDYAHGVEASRILGIYLDQLVDERRENGGDDDFVALLARTEVDGERLPQDVLVSFFRQLMNAGGDTSYHGFSNILTALFTHPEQFSAVAQNRALMRQAIEEGLRWEGPLIGISRATKRDVVLGGVPVPAGAFLHVGIGAANRDETIWERPEAFDMFRSTKRHVAFGYGTHVCIGQHLARMELTMALNDLLNRLPNLRLDPDKPPPVIRGVTLRGAEHVHVRFG
jgi:cytochrome P450